MDKLRYFLNKAYDAFRKRQIWLKVVRYGVLNNGPA